MQLYELTAGRSIDEVLRDLAEIGSRDREITLVVPAGNELLNQVENLSRLRRFVQSQNLSLRAVVADRVALGLFRIMGFDVDEVTSMTRSADPFPTGNSSAPANTTAPAAAAPAADQPTSVPVTETPVVLAPAAPSMPEVPPTLPSSQATPTEPPRRPGGTGGLKMKIKMKTQHGETNTEAEAAPAPVDTPTPPRSPMRQWNPPVEPAIDIPTASELAAAGTQPPVVIQPAASANWDAQSSMAASSQPGPIDTSAGDSNDPLDVTLPVPPAEESEGDTTASGSSLDVTLPTWMSESQSRTGASNGGEVPAWLHGSSPSSPQVAAAPQEPSVPAWLRQEQQPAVSAAPPTTNLSELPPLPSAPVPAEVREPALTAEAVKDAAIAQAGGASIEGRALPPMDTATLTGAAPAASDTGAKETVLDGRTRALLLFGMALVRLALPEAQAAAASARRLGCSDNDLKLVVQMAQAIGGGPSERLGRRIVGQ